MFGLCLVLFCLFSNINFRVLSDPHPVQYESSPVLVLVTAIHTQSLICIYITCNLWETICNQYDNAIYMCVFVLCNVWQLSLHQHYYFNHNALYNSPYFVWRKGGCLVVYLTKPLFILWLDKKFLVQTSLFLIECSASPFVYSDFKL